MNLCRRTLVQVLLITALLLLPSEVLANQAQERANDLSARIMSPFCPGVTLHECPSAEAIRVRKRIAGWFASGWTNTEVMEKLRSEYGDGIQAVPPAGSFGVMAWLLPILVLGAGAVIVWLVLKRGTRRSAETPVVRPEDRVALERELASLRAER